MFKQLPLKSPLFALGFLTTGFQIFLLRHLVIICCGFEPAVGAALSAWILFTGLGSFTGQFLRRWLPNRKLLDFLLLSEGLPALWTLMIIRWVALKIIPAGSIPGPPAMILVIFIAEIPFCLVSGFLFTGYSMKYSRENISSAYYTETAGSVVAGAMINLVFLWYFNDLDAILAIICLFAFIFLLSLLKRDSSGHLGFGLFLTILVLSSAFYSDFDTFLDREKFTGQKVIRKINSPSGQVVLTQSGQQLNCYENGSLLFSSGDVINNEESVHYAMLQHTKPSEILLVSGGFSGTVREIQKYHPGIIDYTGINPALAGILRDYSYETSNNTLNVHETDARRFINRMYHRYDIALVNLTSPATLQLNRYYSLEFTEEIKQSLKTGGIACWSLPSTGDYAGKNSLSLYASIYANLDSLFKNVLVVPGNKNYFIASDSALSLNFDELLKRNPVSTNYVNPYYLDISGMKERSDLLTSQIREINFQNKKYNTDFHPVAVWRQGMIWFSFFNVKLLWPVLILSVIFIFALLTLNPVSAGLFSGGFSIASVEIILIYSLQVLSGVLYFMMGIVIALIMAGIALGSVVKIKSNYRNWILIQTGMGILMLTITIAVNAMCKYNTDDLIDKFTISLFALISGWITGAQFRIAANLVTNDKIKTISGNYSADLFGGALGMLLTSMLIIPFAGIVQTGVILLIINILTAILAYFRILK